MNTAPVKLLSAFVMAAALVACASKKTDDSGQASIATAPQPAAEQPVAAEPGFAPDPAVAQPATPIGTQAKPASKSSTGSSSSGAASANPSEGFESKSSHYSGDTATRAIYFAFDRAEIPSAAYASLKAHARHLAGNAAAKLTIEGHCDERGTPEYNVALGERRAKALKDFLVMNGAKGEQIEVLSFGEEKPAELGHDELSWAKNRRGELNYSAGKP